MSEPPLSPLFAPLICAACIAGHRKAVYDLAYMNLLRPEAFFSRAFRVTTLMFGLDWLSRSNSHKR